MSRRPGRACPTRARTRTPAHKYKHKCKYDVANAHEPRPGSRAPPPRPRRSATGPTRRWAPPPRVLRRRKIQNLHSRMPRPQRAPHERARGCTRTRDTRAHGDTHMSHGAGRPIREVHTRIARARHLRRRGSPPGGATSPTSGLRVMSLAHLTPSPARRRYGTVASGGGGGDGGMHNRTGIAYKRQRSLNDPSMCALGQSRQNTSPYPSISATWTPSRTHWAMQMSNGGGPYLDALAHARAARVAPLPHRPLRLVRVRRGPLARAPRRRCAPTHREINSGVSVPHPVLGGGADQSAQRAHSDPAPRHGVNANGEMHSRNCCEAFCHCGAHTKIT